MARAKTATTATATTDSVVLASATGVTLEPDTLTIDVGAQAQLTATVEPEDADDKTVSYSSDAQEVASVSTGGLVTGVLEGSANITVTTTDGGFIDTCAVTVAAKDLPLVDLSLLMADNWPSNAVLKKSTVYLNLDDLTLQADQIGKLVQTPEGFVLERIDLAVVKPTEMDLSLKLATDNNTPLAKFTIAAGSEEAIRGVVTDGKVAGDYLPETWINLINTGDAQPAGAGRLALSIIGYTIEPWR